MPRKIFMELKPNNIATIESIDENVAKVELSDKFAFDVFLNHCRINEQLNPGDKVRLHFVFDKDDEKYIEIEKLSEETETAKNRSIELQNNLFK